MNRSAGGRPRPTRRSLVGAAAGLASTAAGGGLRARAVADGRSDIEPFWGVHQAGITTPAQAHTYTATLDLLTDERDALTAMLRAWTTAAARLTDGMPAQSLAQPTTVPAADSGEALELAAARLTLTFGFGPGLFVRNGKDRYGLANYRPAALVDLPQFDGDELIETRSGGDLSMQACADDPQVAFHAVRQLVRIAHGVATVRWTQAGFLPVVGPQQKPRNLMGFRDGTNNLRVDDPAAMDKFVWVGEEGPKWMRGGSYVVFRRIRIALEHWDRMPLDFQEGTFGRHKYSGAPLGLKDELDAVNLGAADRDGSPVVPESAHVRLAAASTNDRARILRRAYSYNDGFGFVAERWPPWRQASEYDAGLFFVCYQRDPRMGFIKIFDRLAKFDMLNQFVTHTGGGVFACPCGVAPGEFIGQHLFPSV